MTRDFDMAQGQSIVTREVSVDPETGEQLVVTHEVRAMPEIDDEERE